MKGARYFLRNFTATAVKPRSAGRARGASSLRLRRKNYGRQADLAAIQANTRPEWHSPPEASTRCRGSARIPLDHLAIRHVSCGGRAGPARP